MTTLRARIRPEVDVNFYNSFTKGKWYEVDEETAKYLRNCRVGDHVPNLPLVFEVMPLEEAQVLHKAETTRREEVSTPDNAEKGALGKSEAKPPVADENAPPPAGEPKPKNGK